MSPSAGTKAHENKRDLLRLLMGLFDCKQNREFLLEEQLSFLPIFKTKLKKLKPKLWKLMAKKP